MPKLKTKSGAKKRFGRTATGKVKVAHSHKRHLLINKDKQAKRYDKLTYMDVLSQKGPRTRQGVSRAGQHRLPCRDREGRKGAALCLS